MDLNVSPDLDAYLCYGIVFLVGAFVALGEIRRRVQDVPGIWRIAGTWWLFAIYVAVPVGLFWLLDRTGAINDTSFFAALLVGFGYERIITGGNQTIRLGTDASQFWSPFLSYAERIVARVRNQSNIHRRRLADQIIANIGQDENRISTLEDLARRSSSDTKALDDQLREVEDATTRGAAAATEDKVRLLYNALLTSPDVHEQLLQKKIIGRTFYWFRVRSLGAPIAVVALVVLVGVLYWKVDPEMKDYAAHYHLWRVVKTNSTAVDQFRARQNIAGLMQVARPETRDRTMAKLVNLLRQPSLPIERVDLVLQIILENRDSAIDKPWMSKLLAQALRGVGIDVRTRLNDSLRFLREYCKADPHSELVSWKPSDGDGPVGLERKIRHWEDYWAKPCEPIG